MFFLPKKETPILCQGITSQVGAVHTELALAYGANIVAGISADKNIRHFLGVPVFKTVAEAVREKKPQISVIFSTPAHALADVAEAVRAGIKMIVCITESVPMHDALKMKALAKSAKVCLLGPSSMGMGVAGETVVGSVPLHLFSDGPVALLGRSASLMLETATQLKEKRLGLSAFISLGADHLIGTSFVEPMKALLKDEKTKKIVLIGQVHGELEYELAAFYKKQKNKKPLWVYIPGRSLEKSDKHPLLGMKTVRFADIIDLKKQVLTEAGAFWVDSVDNLGKMVGKGKSK